MLDETTYYFTAFAIDQNNNIIDSETLSITTDFGWHVTPNTLFYIKNNGEITDHSQYNHAMQWYGTEQYTTLASGKKVAKFTGSNVVHSTTFNEANNKTTFTMHVWCKITSYNTSQQQNIAGWMGRSQSSSSTTDRWGAKWEKDAGSSQIYHIIYGGGTSSWISNTNVGFNPSTTQFELLTFTINGKSVKVYKNASLVGSWTGTTNIRGGSTTGTIFVMGGSYSYDGVASAFQQCEIGETVLEDKVQTDAEILQFYNKTKKNYV